MQYMPTPTLTPREQIDKALASKDNDDVHPIKDLSSAKDEEKFQLIDILRKQTWVGYFDELALERIWGSFGDAVVGAPKGQLPLPFYLPVLSVAEASRRRADLQSCR